MLRKVGEGIASKLDGMSDERSREAVQAWEARGDHNRLRIIEAATGYPPELVEEVEPAFYSEEERDWSTIRSDELLAAARMVGPQPSATLRPNLEALRGVQSTDCSELDRISQNAVAFVSAMQDEPPFAQGHELAAWLRSEQGATQLNRRVNPDAILESWGVPLIEVGLGLRDIDAIGCWGPRHGPAVLLNSDARHGASRARRRATLAHEICHLLVDRASSLPLVEVFGGRTARQPEQRARAFAAELLLPREIAGQEFSDCEGNEAWVVRSLRARFGISSELLAWQARNSGYPLAPNTRRYLSNLVQNPSEFGWI